MLPMFSILRASVVAAIFALPVAAQTVAVPGTGCPGVIPLVPGGAPQVGQLAQICYTPNLPATQVWGVAFTSCGPFIPLPFGLMCYQNCVLYGVILDSYVIGFLGQPGPYCFTFLVPNNPGLIGASYCAHAWGWGPALGGCFGLSNAIQGTVTP